MLFYSMVGEYCPALKQLDTSECRDVSEESLAVLRSKGIRVDMPQAIKPTLNVFLQNLKLLQPKS